MRQAETNLDSLDESRFFMIPAEGADCVDALVDFIQRLSVHKPVEFLKIGFDGCVIDAPDSL